MKIFKQLLIILAINFIGELLQKGLHIPIPGSIIGLFILLSCLLTGVIKEEQIDDTAIFLLENMPFFFVPAGVGVMVSYKYLQGNLFYSILTIILSTILVIIVTSLVTEFLIKLNKDDEGNNK